MPMDIERIAAGFEWSTKLIQRFIKDIDHAESVLAPPIATNSLNWVVGHIVQSRDELLKRFGKEGLMTQEEYDLYCFGSKPIGPDDPSVDFLRLVEMLPVSAEKLAAVIRETPLEKYEEIVNEERGTTFYGQTDFSYWHESYHVGQLEVLRNIGGAKPSFP